MPYVRRGGVAYTSVGDDRRASQRGWRVPITLPGLNADQGQRRYAHLLAARKGRIRQAAPDAASFRVSIIGI